MEQVKEQKAPFKLNMKRTMLIGFAFFGILLLWQVYDSWCPTLLSELFARMMHPDAFPAGPIDPTSEAYKDAIKDVQYLVGVMMALDNVAALLLLPVFGHLSDKTHTRLGKRMPYILVGTVVCAIAFPFIPVVYHFAGSVAGVIALMAIVLLFAMMYRNPAVALMPDMTPKPLRSKANGIINIMGYIGGFFATLVGMIFVLTDYLGTTIKNGVATPHTWAYHNIWALELPFLIASVLMVISAVVLLFNVKENKIHEEIKDEMARGELEAEVVDQVSEEKPLSKANKIMLILILAAEFFWFMADNGIQTFMGNYTIYYLGASSGSLGLATILGGVGSVIGFAVGGIIASKISRKWTVVSGLGITLLSYLVWVIFTFTIAKDSMKNGGSIPIWLYAIWGLKGFGMSLVHVNSFPMVVELCPSSKIGRYTGLYYTASMLAQTITPIALGLILYVPSFDWDILPIYASIAVVASLTIFFFIKNAKNNKTKFTSGLEGIGSADD